MVVTPFDIAADFLVDMSFSSEKIAGMLKEYEGDHHTGMDIKQIACLLYDYTSGYPYLVSRICKSIDERLAGGNEYSDGHSAWTKEGFLAAVRMLLAEPNTLFDSLINKLADYPELKPLLCGLLFQGKEISYAVGVPSIKKRHNFPDGQKTNRPFSSQKAWRASIPSPPCGIRPHRL